MSVPIVNVYRKHPILFWIWLIGSVAAYFVMGAEALVPSFLVFVILWWIGDRGSCEEWLNKK